MKVDVTTTNGWVTVKVIGRVDNFTYPILENDVNILLKTGVKQLLFDMEEASHISMSFIRLLNKTQERLHSTGGKVVISSMSKEIKSKLDNFFKSDHLITG